MQNIKNSINPNRIRKPAIVQLRLIYASQPIEKLQNQKNRKNKTFFSQTHYPTKQQYFRLSSLSKTHFQVNPSSKTCYTKKKFLTTYFESLNQKIDSKRSIMTTQSSQIQDLFKNQYIVKGLKNGAKADFGKRLFHHQQCRRYFNEAHRKVLNSRGKYLKSQIN